MSEPLDLLVNTDRNARRLAHAALAFSILGVLSIVFGFWAPTAITRSAAWLFGAAITVAGLVLYFLKREEWQPGVPTALSPLIRMIETDPSAQILTDPKVGVLFQNRAAERMFGDLLGYPIAGALAGHFANPDAMQFLLEKRAASSGFAAEDLITRSERLRLSVNALSSEHLLWRFEDLGPSGEASGALEGVDIPAATIDANGKLTASNSALRYLVGGETETVEALLHDPELRSGSTRVIETLQGPRNFVVALSCEDDGARRVHFVPANNLAGGTTLGSSIGVAGLPVPLLLIDGQGKIADANVRAETLIGRPIAIGSFMSDLFEGLGRSVSDWLTEAQNGKSVARPEVLKVRNPDKEVFLQVSFARADTGNEDKVLLAVLNDATELKTMEAQFVQGQKMQAIGQLAGGVAHDFNNLLTAISGHCDLLLLRHDQGDPDYADLVQIHQNANRAASLVGQLLAFSRKQNLQPEVLELRDTLSDLTHLLNRLVGEKVRLKLAHEPDLPAIRADKRQLEQVLMNLVVNARDAMPDGGEIRVSTAKINLEEPLNRNRASVPAGDYVVVQVADDGIGIPADKLPKIFEPFYTTKRLGEGTGLGLSTAYGIIKQTGGFIFADSEQGKGTTFSIYFPVHRPVAIEAKAAKPGAAPQAHKPGEGVILLVEDEAPVRAFASRALRMRGYQVLEAENAEEALETLKDDNLEIDVFVTDVIMPGLDGPTWVQEALKKRPNTKVIFVSGYAEENMADQQARIPNSVFLPKPFSLNELATTVMEQMH